MAGSGVDLEIFAGDCTHQELETCREKGNVLLKVGNTSTMMIGDDDDDDNDDD
jgi:hypothetical protein